MYEPILPSSPFLPRFRRKGSSYRGRGKGTISFFLPDQFEIACPFSGRSTTSRYIVYTGPTSARNLPLLALNLANWTTGRFASGTYLPTRRTAQLFNCCAGKFRINYAWAAIPRRNSGTIRSFAVSLIVFALCLPNFRILLYNSGGFCFRLFLFHTNIFLHLPKNTTIFWRKVINLDPI